jgi:hypothetical protein
VGIGAIAATATIAAPEKVVVDAKAVDVKGERAKGEDANGAATGTRDALILKVPVQVAVRVAGQVVGQVAAKVARQLPHLAKGTINHRPNVNSEVQSWPASIKSFSWET